MCIQTAPLCHQLVIVGNEDEDMYARKPMQTTTASDHRCRRYRWNCFVTTLHRTRLTFEICLPKLAPSTLSGALGWTTWTQSNGSSCVLDVVSVCFLAASLWHMADVSRLGLRWLEARCGLRFCVDSRVRSLSDGLCFPRARKPTCSQFMRSGRK